MTIEGEYSPDPEQKEKNERKENADQEKLLKGKEEDGEKPNKEQQEKQVDLLIPEIENPNIIIDQFLSEQPEFTSKSLDLRKLENSNIYILRSKKFTRLATLAKLLIDRLSGEESIVETTKYLDAVDMFVISVREAKLKTRKTILSTEAKDFIYDNDQKVQETLSFLFRKVVLDRFISEKKQIPGRECD